MSPIHRWFAPLALALALATPVSAQWKPVTDGGRLGHVSSALDTPAPELSLPSASHLAGMEHSAPAFTAPPLPGVQRTSTDVALMIVGGAALILGSVIGDDAGALMMVGGGVVGLFGLYQYLT